MSSRHAIMTTSRDSFALDMGSDDGEDDDSFDGEIGFWLLKAFEGRTIGRLLKWEVLKLTVLEVICGVALVITVYYEENSYYFADFVGRSKYGKYFLNLMWTISCCAIFTGMTSFLSLRSWAALTLNRQLTQSLLFSYVIIFTVKFGLTLWCVCAFFLSFEKMDWHDSVYAPAITPMYVATTFFLLPYLIQIPLSTLSMANILEDMQTGGSILEPGILPESVGAFSSTRSLSMFCIVACAVPIVVCIRLSEVAQAVPGLCASFCGCAVEWKKSTESARKLFDLSKYKRGSATYKVLNFCKRLMKTLRLCCNAVCCCLCRSDKGATVGTTLDKRRRGQYSSSDSGGADGGERRGHGEGEAIEGYEATGTNAIYMGDRGASELDDSGSQDDEEETRVAGQASDNSATREVNESESEGAPLDGGGNKDEQEMERERLSRQEARQAAEYAMKLKRQKEERERKQKEKDDRIHPSYTADADVKSNEVGIGAGNISSTLSLSEFKRYWRDLDPGGSFECKLRSSPDVAAFCDHMRTQGFHVVHSSIGGVKKPVPLAPSASSVSASPSLPPLLNTTMEVAICNIRPIPTAMTTDAAAPNAAYVPNASDAPASRAWFLARFVSTDNNVFSAVMKCQSVAEIPHFVRKFALAKVLKIDTAVNKKAKKERQGVRVS